ncbi:MAG: trigger factor [Kiritimatiellia bacterium]|jgi:trigger factor
MNIDIEINSPTRSKLLCTVTSEEYEAEKKLVTREFVSKAVIPGFRKGKAPREVVLDRFSKDITNETVGRATQKYYTKAVEEKELRVFELVDVSTVKRTDEGGLAFTATVDLVPEFELPEFEGIPVDSADTPTTDEDVEKQFESIRKSMATFKDFTEGYEAVQDDMLFISYTATVDGQPMETAVPDAGLFAKREDFWCTVGGKHLQIPGLADALVGVKLGETRAVQVVFPEDFSNEKLRGVAADYDVVVKEGRHLALPEIDETFLKSFECETLDQLKERIRTNLETYARQQDRQRRSQQIVDYLLKATPFEVPAAEFDRQTEEALNLLVQYGMRRGVSKEDLAAERERLTATAKEQADGRIRTRMILRQIASKLEINVPEDDFDRYLVGRFHRERLGEAEIKETLKNRDRMDMLYTDAVIQKTLDTLLDKAKPTDTLNA